jgi:hypothetical protein
MRIRPFLFVAKELVSNGGSGAPSKEETSSCENHPHSHPVHTRQRFVYAIATFEVKI